MGTGPIGSWSNVAILSLVTLSIIVASSFSIANFTTHPGNASETERIGSVGSLGKVPSAGIEHPNLAPNATTTNANGTTTDSGTGFTPLVACSYTPPAICVWVVLPQQGTTYEASITFNGVAV